MAAMAAMTSSAAVVAALPAGLRSTGSSAGRQVVSFGVRRAAVERVPAVVVVAAEASPEAAAVSRRQLAVSLTALSVALLSSSQRQAEARESRDIPLFGLKKVKQIGAEVVQEVKELVKEGEGGVAAVGGAISGAVAGFPGAALPNIPSGGDSGLSPALQAGIVAGAGVVGVLVASTVVNSLVSPVK